MGLTERAGGRRETDRDSHKHQTQKDTESHTDTDKKAKGDRQMACEEAERKEPKRKRDKV